jgi:hypothetical protein
MTKVDKDNYLKGVKQDVMFNDAHAALRGYAQSNLTSSIILSAGMNPRLYGYFTSFPDFFPDAAGFIRKKIVLKVSDYRSALIQGKFLAKKGLWVSEYRIESGLNCGGHAFASDGHLMGPVLAEFRDHREELRQTLHQLLVKALEARGGHVPNEPLPVRLTAQGGVGTAQEHQFLLDHYLVDSVGWGTPFLLVPEVTNIDEDTLQQLANATEKDLYLSNISPLGVPFNSMRGNTKDEEKQVLIDAGNPGSTCPKRYIALNTEFTGKGICTASRQFQKKKIESVSSSNLTDDEQARQYNEIVEKSCICVGLGTSALLVNNLDTKIEGAGVSVCPGPNMAYFSRKMTLRQITDHIYGRDQMIDRMDRPHMFVKELEMNVAFLQNQVTEVKQGYRKLSLEHLRLFAGNLEKGTAYYLQLVRQFPDRFISGMMEALERNRQEIELTRQEIEALTLV